MELRNAGVNSREFLAARIGLCSEAVRRFPGEEQWRIENLRRALAETYFEIGEHCTADELFESWLTADPRLGLGLDRLGRLLPRLGQGRSRRSSPGR